MTLAKGLTSGYVPLGAAVVNDDIYETLSNVVPSSTTFSHGFTYSGHPVGAAAALECIRLYETEVLAKVPALGEHLQRRMRERFTDHPWVSDVRGHGMLLAVEFSKDKYNYDPFNEIADALRTTAYANGLRVRVFANATVGFAPPLICSTDEIDLIVDRFGKTVDEVYAQGEALRQAS